MNEDVDNEQGLMLPYFEYAENKNAVYILIASKILGWQSETILKGREVIKYYEALLIGFIYCSNLK